MVAPKRSLVGVLAVVATILAVVGAVRLLAGDQDRFAQDHVGVGRDEKGLFFVTCEHLVIDEVVVRDGSTDDGEVLWRAVVAGGPASSLLRSREKVPGYDASGKLDLDHPGDVSISVFNVDGGLNAIPSYVVFEPSELRIGTIVTGSNDTISMESWTAMCPD